MKQVFRDKIVNVDENKFDNKFLFKLPVWIFESEKVEIIFMEDLLKERKNEKLFQNLWDKYAMYSNVYSPKDELEIFKDIFNKAISTWKRVHIVWVSLWEELDILENYYKRLGFMRADVNCYEVDFSIPLVTVSVKLENLMWKGSDYKSQKEKIFFIPPPRESWHTRSLFKGINRWIVAWIYPFWLDESKKVFINDLVASESILPIRLAEMLNYNFKDIWFNFDEENFIVEY